MSDRQTLITTKEARKLLGQRSKKLTNEDLEQLIIDTETVVRIAVRRFIGSIKSKNGATMDSERTRQT